MAYEQTRHLLVDAEHNPTAEQQPPQSHAAPLPKPRRPVVSPHTPDCVLDRRPTRALRPCLDHIERLRGIDGDDSRHGTHGKSGGGIIHAQVVLPCRLPQEVVCAHAHRGSG